MRAKQASITAENNAAVRAFEAMRPAAERICCDPFARFFLPEEISGAENQADALEQVISRWNLVVPGVCDAILARTRFIDDHLQAAIDGGLQQLEIFGAGYDSRALRFGRLMDRVSIFELDHPTTQQTKLQRMAAAGLSAPKRTIFIPCRFDKDDFTAKLQTNGYDSRQKTFFIWEGVTYYLSAGEVDHTLHFISRHSPAGSGVVFDYFPPSVADGTCRLEEAMVLRHALQQMGEEITFGIDPGAVGAFLAERGLTLQKKVTHQDLYTTGLKPIDRPVTVSAMFHFVYATVHRATHKRS